ncbi:hypothetical protein TSUD_73020 [Trifolium subterraneum]|uniref:Uncharacterized protein n=1 Tax=Trifolium subterraneum TaxID=3900 RepID=A0A2Z6M2D1_TRISU|nr:hypothetical protein TSUD_73020 [Trifolium subterraneum]
MVDWSQASTRVTLYSSLPVLAINLAHFILSKLKSCDPSYSLEKCTPITKEVLLDFSSLELVKIQCIASLTLPEICEH